MDGNDSMNLDDFNPRIALDGEDIAVGFGDHEVWRIAWAAVVEIAIWRDDSAANDGLCFGLRTLTMKPGEYMGVADGAKGFADALEEIDRRFDGAYTFHWKDAVFPPMATQWAVVYGEPTGRAERAEVIWPEAA
jgi:hypothetical protein